jgi:hypothetical protein
MRRAGPFQRRRDVYSLGCILLEIGTWKALEAFSWSKKYDEDHERWRRRLLEEFEKLRAMCGTRYAETVKTCLEYGGNVGDGGNDVGVDVQKLAFDVLLSLEATVV